jgi:glycosyltransferase involved in cell wall biosynthesis
MKISYAIPVCNELKEIKKLISLLQKKKRDEDEIVILFDKGNGTAEVWAYLKSLKNCIIKAKTFKNHFANWKNYLTSLCTGDYIFQIDADETPHPVLLEFISVLSESNPYNEVYLVPRINTVEGLTQQHIQQWGWNVNEEGWINFPDWQGRVFKNRPNIKWEKPVHEMIKGFQTYAHLPTEKPFCMLHYKKIEKQEQQNKKYDGILR